MNNYDVTNWYWLVGGDASQVYSSAAKHYVPLDGVTYVAWLAAGNTPTKINNGAELYEVLSNQWVPGFLANGIAVLSTGSPSLNATYPMDAASQFVLTSVATGIAAGRGLPGGGTTFLFNGVVFTSEQFLDLASALENFLYNFNIGLATLIQSGGAAGAIPTTPLTID